MQQNVLLITDIGGDIDDILALYTLLGSKETVNLVGIVVCGGEHRKRAILTHRILELLDVKKVPIIAELNDNHLKSSHEFSMPSEFESLLESELPNEIVTSNAYIIDLIKKYYDDIVIVCIGPTTPLADAIRLDGTFSAGISKFYIQGHVIVDEEQLIPDTVNSYNLREDKQSAMIVFENLQKNNVPFVSLGKYAAYQCPISKQLFESWSSTSKAPLHIFNYVRRVMDTFWRHGPELLYRVYNVPSEYQFEDKWFDYLQNISMPYDALLVLSLIQPDLFDTSHTVFNKHVLIGNDANTHCVRDPSTVLNILNQKILTVLVHEN
jgi:inosine-uridine nucleoside N-ribohydrolase